MPVDIRSAVYSGISQQFPAIYQEDGDFLVSFVESYYKYFDETYDRDIPKLRDIDTTLSTFLIYYKKKYLADLPIDTSLDTRFIIKHIQDMYSRKGTQESLELLFRMFFDEDIEVFYPSTAVLRPSDSIWGGDVYLEMKPVFTVDEYPIEKGMRIRGDVSLATAFVDEVIFVNFSGALIPLIYLSNVSGSFSSDDGLQIITITESGDESILNVGRLIAGSIDNITIDTVQLRLPDQQIGDKVKIVSSKSGVEARGRVTKVSDTSTGVIDFSIVDGGFGYVDPQSTTLSVKNDIGVSNQVMVLSGTTKRDVKRGDVIIADGARLNYTGSTADDATDYAITGSARVIEYQHPLLFLYSDDYETVSAYLNRVDTPTAGSSAGTPTNVFIESMKNAATKPYYDVAGLPGVVEPPQFLPPEYTKEFKALIKPNQQFGSANGYAVNGQIQPDNLGYFLAGDVVLPAAGGSYYDPATWSVGNLDPLGAQSRQIMQEYLNVMNLSDAFPTFTPELYDLDYLFAVEKSQWRSYLTSIFLALSKVHIFPQLTISRPKTGTERPILTRSLVRGQDYMIWDNGPPDQANHADWGKIGVTVPAVEGTIFTAAGTDADFPDNVHTVSGESGRRTWQFVARGNLTDTQLQELHLNRLRFDVSSIDVTDATGEPNNGRVYDKSGKAVPYPIVNSPSFQLLRYRGDKALYDSSGTAVSDVESIRLDVDFQSFGVINRTADFEIGSLSNIETVTLIPDLIEDFGNTKLNIPLGEPGGLDGIDGDDYGMSGPSNENLNTRLADAFSPITLKIGTITDLNILNSGIDYQNDVAVAIEHASIAKFNKKDVILNFDSTSFDINLGDIITQDIKIDDLQINQTGNFLHTNAPSGDIYLEEIGVSTTGTSYQNSSTTFEFTTGTTKDYQVKAKFLKREGNDFYFRPISFYGFQGNVSITRVKGNQEYQIIALGNTPLSTWTAIGASDTPKVGEVFTTASDAVIDATIQASNIGTVSIPVNIGPITKILTLIKEDEDSLPMGANAEIKGNAVYQTGQISEVSITKTGYRYSDRETVDIVNVEEDSVNYNKTIAKASIRTLGQGKTEGKWSSKTSFLSESSKNLHDNDYYQEYSYEISSIVTPSKYEPLIKETVGVAGTKLFSKPLVNSVNPLDSNLNLEISTFNIQGTQFASVTQTNASNIVPGEKYKVTDIANTNVSDWSAVGAPTNTVVVQGPANLKQNVHYTVTDIGDASWNDVQYLDPGIREEWWRFWSYFAGHATVNYDFDGDGILGSLDMLTSARQIIGLEPMSSELLNLLNEIKTGIFTSNSFAVMPSFYDKSTAPLILNTVVFTELSVPLGTEFTANSTAPSGTLLTNGKVSYSDSIFVTPYYKNDLSERADHTWGSFTPPQTYLDAGAQPIQLEHNDLLDDPDDETGITNYTHDSARTIRYSDMETGNGLPQRFWRIKSFPIAGNDSTDGHNQYLSTPNRLPDKHIKSWNPEDMSAESSLQKDYLQGLWQTYFITGLEAVTGGAKKIGTRDDPTTYPNIDTTLLESYGTTSGVIESNDIGVPLTYYPNTITTSTGWSISRLELVDVTDNTIVFTPDTMVGEDGYTVTLSNHGMTNDTLLEYRKHTSTGSSGNLDEEYVLTEFVPGSGQTAYSERDIQPHHYYAVNVTENTFQLSKTPMLSEQYPNDVLHDPIDLSTMTDSASGNHLLTKVTGIFLDDSILIGIQEQ